MVKTAAKKAEDGLYGYEIGTVENSEYALQPGELTKQMFADRADATTKSVENWLKAGKIVGEYQRRSVDGKPVRKTLVILESELLKLNETVKTAAIVKPEETSQQLNYFIADNLGKFADVMKNVVESSTKQLTVGSDDRASLFLTIPAASDEYGLAVAELHRLTKDGALKPFRGKHGEILVSRKQIEAL